MEIKNTEIKSKFTKWGYTFECIADNGKRRIYKQTDNENPNNYYYEVVMPRPIKGTNEYRYPSSSEWGRYGKTLRKSEYNRAIEYFNNGW